MTTPELESTSQSLLFLCSRGLLKEKRRTSNKERKRGDTFFPTVFPGVILICGRKVRGGGLAWLAKENLGSIFRETLSFCFQVLEGLALGRQKKSHLFSQNRDPGTSLQQEGCGEDWRKDFPPIGAQVRA